MPVERRTLHEVVQYPAHDPRVETTAYRAVHHQLVVVQDRPCVICGVRQSTLHDAAHNPYGATAIETHHAEIEWALANAIDLGRFNTKLVPYLHRRYGEARYAVPFTQEQLLAWIDHDEHNLEILCSVHHRGINTGVHALTYPIFRVQDLLLDGYNLTGVVAHSPQEAAQLTALPVTTGQASSPSS